MNRNSCLGISVATLLTLLACPAPLVLAANIDSTSANLVEISPPASVVQGALESNTVARIFREQEDYVLPFDLYLDTVGFPPGATIEADGSGGSPGFLPAGTRIDSFYVHFDSVGEPLDAEGAGWFLVFELGDEISGLIFSDSLLDASDYLGAAGTTYPSGETYRGTTGFNEGADGFTWGQARAMSGTQSVTVEVDGVRIILQVPEPGSLALAAFGLPGLLVYLRRRIR